MRGRHDVTTCCLPCGQRTVYQGERLAVWSRNGKLKTIAGPASLSLCCKSVEPLHLHHAKDSEYLEVLEQTGRVRIVPGPASMFDDPLTITSITRRDAIFIDASQLLVVYRRSDAPHPQVITGRDDVAPAKTPVANGIPARSGAESVTRRLVRGPARFVPTAEEWLHEFSWSGVPANASKTSVQPGANNFTKLAAIPSQLYHNVTEVRTNDDTLITVKLMIFYELVDVEMMLDATSDPVADFVNAASADVVAFCSAQSYEAFLPASSQLNELRCFSRLVERAAQIGYTISKVVFRGFQAGAKLQSMHDEAIQERTRLRLLEETQEQEQRASDLKLAAERRRVAKQAELEREQLALRMEISRAEQEATLAQKQAAEEQELAIGASRNAEEIAKLEKLSALGVDLTKVLCAQTDAPGQLIRLEQGGASKAKVPLTGLQLAL